MYKVLAAILIFVTGIGISMGFQNCGGSGLEARNSDNDGLPVEVVTENNESTDNDDSTTDPNDPTNPTDPTDPTNPTTPGTNGFRFQFSQSQPENNIFFMMGGGFSPDLATSRLKIESYYFINTTHVYEQRGTIFTRDLPTDYCTDSALPHCTHTTTAPCIGLGCFKGFSPVRCHWQKRLTPTQESNFVNALNGLRLVNRSVSPTDPMMMDCNDPILQFHSESIILAPDMTSLNVSLANRSCVGDGEYYAMDTTGNNIRTRFINEIDQVRNQMDNSGGDEFCNNYATYAWDTTRLEYKSISGFTTPDSSYFFDVTYEDQKVNMRFKEAGNSTTLCANGVPVQNIEVTTLFPNDGIQYSVLRTDTSIADLPEAEITYEDPVDGGGKWRFFLTKGSALAKSGGAHMDATQANAIKNLIEVVLVRRAKIQGAPWQATTCTN